MSLSNRNPAKIVELAFGAGRATPDMLAANFGRDIWWPLNLGQMTFERGKRAYREKLGWSAEEANRFFAAILESLTPVPGTFAQMDRLAASGFTHYALSDCIHDCGASRTGSHLARMYGAIGVIGRRSIRVEKCTQTHNPWWL